MTAPAAGAPVTALLGPDGRLLRADEALLRLQLEAGGDPTGNLAMPALAALVRLALRLRMPLSRAVELARGTRDISLWADLHPHGEGVHLSLVDWQERDSRQALTGLSALSEAEAAAPAGWAWQVDAMLRFVPNLQAATAVDHALPEPGEAFTQYFRLEDASSEPPGMPMIEALVRYASFNAQPARVRISPDTDYLLSGTALFDDNGVFAGYRGLATPVEQAQAHAAPVVTLPRAARPPVSDMQAPLTPESPPEPPHELFGPALGRRLDSALRRPIDRIIANAGAINAQDKGALRQDYVNYAGDIAAAGRHLLALVDDLADLRSIELNGGDPDIGEVNLGEIARRAAGLLNLRAEARQIRIQAPTEEEQLPARAEYRRVLQILVNLVGNAVRHSPAQSTIWLRLDEADGRARVVVADQGSGIDEADHGRVFERFVRLGNTSDSGSGLGLFISRKLARSMNGDVTVDSALGSGARFTLELPVWQARQSSTRAC